MPDDETLLTHGVADRPEDYAQPRAWRHEEIAGAPIPADWKEKDPLKDFVTYPKRNQKSQNSCTCYQLAKQLSIDELTENGVWRELSPRSVYPYQVVQGGGANSLLVTKHAAKFGMTLEHLLKTDDLTEEEVVKDTGYVTDAKQVALIYAPDHYIECVPTIENIATILETFKAAGKKKGITFSVVGQNNGTWRSTYPKPPTSKTLAPWYHRVIATDYGLIGGKKAISIDNSWGDGIGNKGQQFLFEDYEPYMYGGIYTLNKPDNWQQLSMPTIKPPTYEWTKDLTIGSSGEDVMMLQIALQSVGMFPIDKVVAPTGSYFGITKKGVELFQAAFMLPVTGIVDMATRKKLNEIF